MDKQTLSNYGWLVIVTLILAVMLALATPFGTYVGDAVVSVANGFVGSSNQAMDDDNIGQMQNKWEEKLDFDSFNKLEAGITFVDGTFMPWETLKENGIVTDTDIVEGAFYFDDTISSIVIADGITYIGCGAFDTCINLTSVIMPDTVTHIEESAFLACDSLTTVKLSKNLTTIGVSAFEGCYNLKKISLPNSITYIGEYAFLGCGFTTIALPDDITSISEGAFGNCKSLTSITIPDGVLSIDDIAFDSCLALTSITIPDSVTSIKPYAFYMCENLINISFNGTKAQWNAITFGESWNSYVPAIVVHCADGDITL